MNFYVYRHIRKDKNTPFYIGKGCGKRAYSKSRNAYWKNIVNKTGYSVEILLDELSEEEAFIKEKEFIKLYKSLGYCEANLTEGGEKLGYSQSEEHKSRIGKANKGKTHTEETKQKWSLAQRGNRNKARKIRCIENDTVYNGSSEASRILKINQSNIISVCRGIRSHCGGYTFKYE